MDRQQPLVVGRRWSSRHRPRGPPAGHRPGFSPPTMIRGGGLGASDTPRPRAAGSSCPSKSTGPPAHSARSTAAASSSIAHPFGRLRESRCRTPRSRPRSRRPRCRARPGRRPGRTASPRMRASTAGWRFMTLVTKLPTRIAGGRGGRCGQRRPALEHRSPSCLPRRHEVVPAPDASRSRPAPPAEPTRATTPTSTPIEVRLRPIGIIARPGQASEVPASSAISIIFRGRRLELVERHVVGADDVVVLDQRVADGQDARRRGRSGRAPCSRIAR